MTPLEENIKNRKNPTRNVYINEKKVFHLKELMETFAISKSTALRDIQELEALGATICREWTLWWLSGLAKYVVAAHLL